MTFDQILEYLWLLILLLPLLKRLLMGALKWGQRRASAPAEGAHRTDGSVGAPPSLRPVGHTEEVRGTELQTLADIRERLRAVSEQTAELRDRAGRAGGAALVLEGALSRLGAEQRGVLAEVANVEQEVKSGDVSNVAAVASRLEWESLRVHTVEHMLRVRTDAVLGPRMADADAIAQALTRPLMEFARAQGVDIPQKRVVCVPAEEGAESIWFGLLPRGYPVVYVPDDFESDLFRWPALAHEMGHLMWRDVPHLSDEIHQRTGLTAAPFLIHGEAVWDVRPCFAAWLQEIFCDVVGGLQLGPPALRGLVHFFSVVKHAGSDDRVIGAADGRYDPHPPVHLRVLLVAEALRRQGFHEEVREILGQWHQMAGTVESYVLPLAHGEATALPADVLLAPGKQLVAAVMSGQYDALAGFPLTSIPDFSLGPGLWGRVTRGAQALLADQAPKDTARVLIAAAVEAQAERPSAAPEIAALVARAIVGAGETQSGEVARSRSQAERAPTGASPHKAQARTPALSGRGRRQEILEALVLRQALQRRIGESPGPLGGRARRSRL